MTKSRLVEKFPTIILASASPRRADLLKQIELDFQVYPSGVVETEITHNSPTEIVKQLAVMKAQAVSAHFNCGLIIGADTIVAINQQIIGKPENDQHAIEILMLLSGKRHEVVTGTALLDLDKKREITWAETTAVYFRELYESEILEYVRSHEASDKAGAYGIQGRAAAFVSRVEGCYSNVVGLPLASLIEKLWELAES